MHVIAIIGCGRIANFAHLPALSKQDDVRIKYACDIILEKAEKAKKDFPKIENVIEDYHDALNDPEVEAVFILVPNYEHDRISIDALRAGKHVLCEKPIAVNYTKAKKMEEEAKKANKILNIGVCNRYSAPVATLAKYNKEGRFGRIFHVDCSFSCCRSIPGLGGPFTDSSKSGGGVLIDWGVHFLDLILYVLGGAKIETVSADTYSELAKDMKSYKYWDMWAKDTSDIENGVNDVEELISGYVRTDKASISLKGAWAQNVCADDMYIDFHGTKGGARLKYGGQFTFFNGETLEETPSNIEIPNMYEVEQRSFFDSIATGIPDKGYISNVIEVAKLMDELYASAKEHKELSI